MAGGSTLQGSLWSTLNSYIHGRMMHRTTFSARFAGELSCLVDVALRDQESIEHQLRSSSSWSAQLTELQALARLIRHTVHSTPDKLFMGRFALRTTSLDHVSPVRAELNSGVTFNGFGCSFPDLQVKLHLKTHIVRYNYHDHVSSSS